MCVMIFADRLIWKKGHVTHQIHKNKYGKHVRELANLTWLIALIYSIFFTPKN